MEKPKKKKSLTKTQRERRDILTIGIFNFFILENVVRFFLVFTFQSKV